MKKSLFTVLFVVCIMLSFGQKVPKEVQTRLNSITNAVRVTDNEKKQLIVAIQKLIDSAKEIRTAKREHMALELRENSHRYLSEVLYVLDDERYEKWRDSVKQKK
ncbi:hypothetical protein G5B00_04435 [Parapedobacter sp. SGR-10]|uniref:hypothetical protein n=1 Tax=Parapedobacter sp. SGR-10 TaxID=2710879 RepID=UPI0013D8D3BC|nr:hypothetical protein [Parapedobacter sp. SGR-10]NGF55753.1 hypothetical protein [Parapedobacter sp. SGR-10]